MPILEKRLRFVPHAGSVGASEAPNAFSDDVRNIFDAVRRRAWLFLLVFVPVVAAAAAWIYLSTPQFTSTATIVIDPRKQVVMDSPEVMPDVAADSAVIDTQVQLILSRTVIGMAVDRLGLTALPEKNTRFRTWLTHRIDAARAALQGSSPAASRVGSDPVVAPVTRSQLIDVLLANLVVQRMGLTSAISVSYTDPVADQAAQVTNAIAGSYIEYQAGIKQQATRDASQWLRLRVDELGRQLRSAEAAVDSYRSSAGLLTAKGTTSTESQLTSIDTGLESARQSLSDAEARLSGYRSALKTSGAAEAARVVSSPVMQQLRTQYLTLVDQRAQLSTTFGAKHPQMLELTRQIDAVLEQMNTEAYRTVGELTNEVEIARDRVARLSVSRDESRKQLASDNAATLKLVQLQATADSVRQLYDSMRARLQQTTSQESRDQVNARVVSEAVPPIEPTSPKSKAIVAAALLVGTALGAFAILLAHLFDGTLRRPKDFERRTGAPVLALVPHLKRRDMRVAGARVTISEIVPGKPMSQFAEAFRNLRVAVEHVGDAHRPLVVQMTSGSFAEGKTVSSIAFAQAAALDGRRVLLIDADVRRHSLSNYLGLDAKVGLLEVLRGQVELREAIISGGARRPYVLPLSSADPGPHDRFAGQSFEAFLRVLKSAFDLIVIDSAPVLAVADSLAIARQADAVVLVTRWSSTPLPVVLKAIEEIHRVGGNFAGLLLTQVNIRKVMKQDFGGRYYPALMKYYHQ